MKEQNTFLLLRIEALEQENQRLNNELRKVKDVALDGKIGKRFFILNTDIIKPIPLTEEWLLKFGFETSNRIDLGELKPCYVIFSLALMIRHNSFFIDWIGGNTELKYVHQLQNIYFALTGSELQIGNLTEH